MKKIINLSVALFLIIAVQSCSHDTSSFDTNYIPGIEIDTTGVSSFSVYQFDNLVVEPKLNNEGLAESQLDYEWKINLEPNDTMYQVLSKELNLNEQIAFKPTNPGYAHQLVFTVTDLESDLKYIMSWPVTVLNNIGEGIVVAETYDGITTDISHIMSEEVTTDYTGVSVKYQVYSKINGATIPGLTKQLKYYQIYGQNAVLGITDDMIYKIEPQDYTLAGINDELFYVAEASYKPEALGQVYQGSLFINDGRLTSTYFGASQKFGTPFNSEYSVSSIIAANPVSNPPVTINYYNDEIDKFVYQPSVTQFGDSNRYEIPENTTAPFNPGALTGMVNLAANAATNGDFRHLLKNEDTGEVGIYLFDGGESDYPNTIPPSPIAFYDLTSAPDIEQAQSFVFLDDQKILYYATSTKIYAVLFSGATAVIQERYSVSAGEEITILQVYQQADYPFRSSESYLPLNNKALMMATYNGSEGKVYLLPLINTGIGNIDTPNISTFSGFGKITALGTQL